MPRSRERRTRIIAWVISLLIVVSMALSLAGAFITPRQVTPTPGVAPTPTLTQTPTP